MVANINGMEDLNVKVAEGFDKALSEYKNVSDPYTKVVPSNTTINAYWLSDQMGSMTQEVGPLELQAMRSHRIDVLNLAWHKGIELSDDEVADDLFGQFADQVKKLANAAARIKDEQTTLKLMAGLTEVGYDGVPFFAANHNLSGLGNQSNKLSLALDATNLKTGISALKNFKGTAGVPYVMQGPPVLLVPSALEFTAKSLVNTSLVGGGDSNILSGAATVVVNPYLTEDTRWFLINADSVDRPVFWQERDPIKITPIRDELNMKTIYRARCRGAAALSVWQLALTSKP